MEIFIWLGSIWSSAAGRALVDAFQRSGGPVPIQGLSLGRGKACLCTVSIGGKSARRYRPDASDPVDATEVHMYRCRSIAPLRAFKERLRCVESLISAIERDGFTLSRGLELHRQWSCIVGNGPVRCLDWETLVTGPDAGMLGFQTRVRAAIDSVTEFVKLVVVSRRQSAIRGWRNWILEDPLVHPYRWLPSRFGPSCSFPCLRPCIYGGCDWVFF